MQSRLALFAIGGATLVPAAASCGLIYDYSDYSSVGGASSATSGSASSSGDSVAASTAGTGGSSTSTTSAGVGGSTSASSGASGSGGSLACPSGICRPNIAGAKYVYRPGSASCSAGLDSQDVGECTQCACNDATAKCGVATLSTYSDASCMNQTASANAPFSACGMSGMNDQAIKVKTTDAVPCAPLNSMVPPDVVKLCAAPPSASCPAGDVCAPAAGLTGLCLLYPDDIQCPMSFAYKTTVYADTGGACTCSCTTSCTAGLVTTYASSNCSGQATPVTLNDLCYTAAAQFSSFQVAGAAGATCARAGTHSGASSTLCCEIP